MNPSGLWWDALTKPKETFAKEKDRASVIEIVKHIVILLVIFMIIGFPIIWVFGERKSVDLLLLLGFWFLEIIIIPIIGTLVCFAIAKFLEGKGRLIEQFYLTILFAAPLIIIYEIASFLIPISWIILTIPFIIYGLYLFTLALKEIHGFETLGAVMTWLIPVLIAGVAYLVYLVFV